MPIAMAGLHCISAYWKFQERYTDDEQTAAEVAEAAAACQDLWFHSVELSEQRAFEQSKVHFSHEPLIHVAGYIKSAVITSPEELCRLEASPSRPRQQEFGTRMTATNGKEPGRHRNLRRLTTNAYYVPSGRVEAVDEISSRFPPSWRNYIVSRSVPGMERKTSTGRDAPQCLG